jgi:hypothetical protein
VFILIIPVSNLRSTVYHLLPTGIKGALSLSKTEMQILLLVILASFATAFTQFDG